MQTYTTQMDAARKGIVTPQMETVAKKEYRTVEEIRQLVAEGKVAIPANKHHECLKKILSAKPKIVTVYSLEKAQEISRVCTELGLHQKLMLRFL